MSAILKEEELMEAIEFSQEHREFQAASIKLANRIRSEAQRHGYDLETARKCVDHGVKVYLIDDRGGLTGLTGLPVDVGLFLTASSCGGVFPLVD